MISSLPHLIGWMISDKFTVVHFARLCTCSFPRGLVRRSTETSSHFGLTWTERCLRLIVPWSTL